MKINTTLFLVKLSSINFLLLIGNLDSGNLKVIGLPIRRMRANQQSLYISVLILITNGNDLESSWCQEAHTVQYQGTTAP